ncbi:MAG: serine/threonine protein kinase, partial [Verrucomicrobiae bacterium]|nr:serine/threonine protein kinase [Verrucomicrobiae bacterium]NNJ85864.1 serine/threonine protein kinase [Akkermansiaceae bacterium]
MRSAPEELKFGNFKILRRENGDLWELGRGGFGTTYKAEHTHLMRECALKVINDSRVASEDARRRFLQEARAAASLLHPHIAAVYDFGDSDGTFYYAMEFCAGGDLEHFVEKKGALTWAELEPLAVQIASALARAHQSGLLHRDLKPSNVMLSSDDYENIQLKLIDFGLVKVLDIEKTSSTQVMVTQEGAAGFNPLTASPEQLRDEDLDARSDLFSFGVTLLYLLCGGVPFGNVSAPLMMAQRLDDESYDRFLPKDLTGIGREVVSRLLQKDRDLRYASAEEVANAIQSSSYVVGASEHKDVDAAVDEVPLPTANDSDQDIDWASVWEVSQILQKCHSGSYYRCIGRHEDIPDVIMYLPSHESDHSETIVSYADQMVDLDTSMLLSHAKSGYMEGERAYICQPWMGSGGRLLQLLQAQGNFTLQTHLCLFQQLAKAIDEAAVAGLPGLELNASMIMVDQVLLSDESAPDTPDDWLAYFEKQISSDNSYTKNVRLTVLPKFEDAADEGDIQATVTLEDLATDPLTKFGSLIYRSISGMSVRPAAYLRESGYVSTSNLGEESNRFLSEIIANRSEVSSATEVVSMLCDFEGVSWEVESLESHISGRRD